MTTIDVPESLRFFWGSRGDNAAIARLAENTEPPDDLSWEELPLFATGLASADRVKADLWLFLYDAWGATWGAALKTVIPDARLGMISEYEDDAPSVTRVWEERAINNWTEIGRDRWLKTAVWVDGDFPAVLKLGFTFGDDSDFGDAWTPPDDEWRSTVDGLPLPGGGPLDPTPWRALAERVLRELAE